MVLHFQNAVFDAFFPSMPRYWMKARDSNLGQCIQETQWCVVVHVLCACTTHAPHQIYTSQYCTTPMRFCQICHTLQSGLQLQPKHLQQLTLGLHVLHGKNGPKTPITTLTFLFAKLHLYGWYWDNHHEALYVYELWCHNNQAQQPYLQPRCHLSYHLQHTYLPATTIMERTCLHESSYDICPRMTFSYRYTVVWWVPRYL